MITLDGKRYMAKGICDNISHAICQVNGVDKVLDICNKSVINDRLEIKVYLDDSCVGRVGNFRIVDKLETPVFTPGVDFVKSKSNSLLLTFTIDGMEVVVNDNVQ